MNKQALAQVMTCLTIGLAVAAFPADATTTSSTTNPSANTDVPPSTEELRTGLMAALGNSFKYVGDEFRYSSPDASSGRRSGFWFAKVRAIRAGEYAFSYRIRCVVPPDAPLWMRPGVRDQAILKVPICIACRGTQRTRVKTRGSTWSARMSPSRSNLTTMSQLGLEARHGPTRKKNRFPLLRY